MAAALPGCRKPWLNHFSPLLAQLGIEAPSSTVGSFQSGGAFADQRALTIESSLMSGCGKPQRKCPISFGSSFEC